MDSPVLDIVAGRDFALLHRAELQRGRVECLVGRSAAFESLRAAAAAAQAAELPSLVVVPFCQLKERDFEVVDDGEDLLLLSAQETHTFGLADFDGLAGASRPAARNGAFTDTEAEYCESVQRIITEEIAHGAGSNFVIKRTYSAELDGVDDSSMLAAFAELLRGEDGSYWTFLVRIGDLYLLGATPERHVTLRRGRIVMNPISGTFRRGAAGAGSEKAGLLSFLADEKEADELCMVLDEELKMMASLCRPGTISVTGPELRQMSRVIHTEFKIKGDTDLPLEDVLLRTMFAPAVTGSPIRNACRVIARHERTGRSYYAGYLGLIQPGAGSAPSLDSAITIRSAQVRRSGTGWRLRIDVGSTLVRHSDPLSELAETQAKAGAILGAVCTAPSTVDDLALAEALRLRRNDINPFWLRTGRWPGAPGPKRQTRRKRAVLVDAEDDFNSMLAHQLSGFGYVVNVVPNERALEAAGLDALVIFGPGPGNPCDDSDVRLQTLTAAIRHTIDQSIPFLAVCLSHQMLCRILGLPVHRLAVPNQGVARSVDWFGRSLRLGFYNAFAGRAGESAGLTTSAGERVQLAVDSGGDVTGLTAASFVSMQFHPESALSVDGTAVLEDSLVRLGEL